MAPGGNGNWQFPDGLLVPYVIDSAVKLRIDALAMTEPIRDKETDRQEVYRQAER